MIKRFQTWLLAVAGNNPDDLRRRKLLAILSAGLTGLSVILLAGVYLVYPFSLDDIRRDLGLQQIVLGALAMISVGLVALAATRQRRVAIRRVSAVFLAVFLVVLLLVKQDTKTDPDLVAWGMLIIFASVLISPAAAFGMAAAEVGTLLAWTLSKGYAFGVVQWFELFGLALAAWLSARSLENALLSERIAAGQNEAILAAMSDAVIVLSPAGEVVRANPAAIQYTDSQEMMAALRSGAIGEAVRVARRVFSIAASQVERIGTLFVIRDETRRAEVEAAKDAMMGTVSHELRTPLSGILGFAELIIQQAGDPMVKSLAERIANSGKRLKSLVNDLLDEAQINAGTLKLIPREVEVAREIDEFVGVIKPLAEQKKLLLRVEIDLAAPPKVVCDHDRLQQVLVNLGGNAVKFTDSGHIQVQVYPVGTQAWGISVTDTGDGIPPERLPDIFEPFRRGSDYATRKRQGAGLGLSISKKLIERMGGSLSVTSEPGRGSTFYLQLPQKGIQP